MKSECIVNCYDNPDAVEKINWKCVECGADLKKRQEEVIDEREQKVQERFVKQRSEYKGLSPDEIQKRRKLQ